MMLHKLLSKTPLAWLQLIKQRTRLAVAIAGIAFADMLMFVQLGILDGLYDSATQPHRNLRADLVLVNVHLRTLVDVKSLPRERLHQALAYEGVESIHPLYVRDAAWRNPNTKMNRNLNQDIDATVIATLENLGLGDRANYYPENLSGGQKQRVANDLSSRLRFARALISQPKIVLADEPTAALDKKSGRDVVEQMQTLAKEQGCTILLVTHDNRILDIADRIIHMEDGCLIMAKVSGS